MRNNSHRLLVAWLSFSFCLLLTAARGESPLDKIQKRTQITNTALLQFMYDIYLLETHVQERLIRARLTNADLVFHPDNQLTLKCSRGGLPEKYSSSTSSSRARIYEEFWILFSYILMEFCPEVAAITDHKTNDLTLLISVVIVLDEELLSWMRARKEYMEYSKEPINQEDVTLAFSGKIVSSELQKTEPAEELDRDPSNDGLEYHLKLKISAYSVETISWGGFTGSVSAHTRWLKGKTAQWVKFYMGEGAKPN